MRAALLLALVGVGISLPRIATGALRIHGIYDQIDDALGSGRYEADHPSIWRRLLALLSGNWREVFTPTHLRGVVAMPGGWRQRRYVRLTFRPKPWPRPYFRHDIIAVTCRPTGEVHVHGKLWGVPYFDALGMKIAQALGLEWSAGLFEVTRHRGRRGRFTGWVTYRVTRPAHVPDQLAAEEELGA